MKIHQFRRVLLHVRFELDRLESALLKLEACEFPSSIALTLVGEQRAISADANKSLDQIELDFVDDPDGAAARLVSEFRKLVSRRRYLEVLEKARSDEVPWSLVPSIETLASGLGQLKIRVLLFPIFCEFRRVHSSFCRHGSRHEYQEVYR